MGLPKRHTLLLFFLYSISSTLPFWETLYDLKINDLSTGARDEPNPYASNPASLFLAHQQLREAASQHYQV